MRVVRLLSVSVGVHCTAPMGSLLLVINDQAF
jgi:hypothetical protein